MQTIKKLIWLYFWLLLVEGALRKWCLPSLDTALLLVRDPIVLWIYILAWRRGVFPRNLQLGIGLILVLFSGLIGLISSTPVAVLLFGMRVNLLHLPLMYLMPLVFDRDDVVRVGRYLLYTAIPMSLLIAYQFVSPEDSWINKGAFPTHYDSVRPSATFPFVTGTALYLAFVAAYLAYAFLQKGRLPFWLMLGATMALLVSLAVSGSRLAVTSVALVGLGALIAVMVRGRGFGGVITAVVVGILAVFVLGQLEVFREGTSQLDRRFEDANPDQTSQTAFLTSRVSGDTDLALQLLDRTPLLGHGTGLGTSVGSQLTLGERIFLGSEGEWGRLIWESGPIIGVLFILYRCWLAFGIGLVCFRALRQGEFLGVLIFCACLINLVQGQWGVTNVQGFGCFEAGLALAACRKPMRRLLRDLVVPMEISPSNFPSGAGRNGLPFRNSIDRSTRFRN